MRFSHYLEEFVDDEGYLQATYQAGLQVERMKALEKTREAARPTKPEEKKKDGQNRGGSDNTRKGKEEEKRDVQLARRTDQAQQAGKQFGTRGTWATREEALKGVPRDEREEYGKNEEDCWRCGKPGHRTHECYAFNTQKGTPLPPAPWKASAVGQGKRKRSEESEQPPAT